MRSPRAMMRCWRGRPGLQALRGKSGAAGAREAERPAPSWGALPDLLAGRAPGRRRQQQQPPPGAPCGARDAAALQARSLLSRFFCSRAGDGAEGPRKPPAVERRSRAWEQSLSPLERLSRLVPEGCLTEAVEAVRSAEAAQETAVGATGTRRGPSPEPLLSATSGDVPFQAGELMVAEYRRRRRAVVRKLCRLTAGGVLQSSWGTLPFAHVLGRLPGQLLLTSIGQPFLVRRPSLEDYVLLMKRGPAIAYPKDINAMLLLMDINQGDVVLEAGSGSGALSLFLSRAVGPLGHVISYEVRNDHHNIAKTNYQNWRAAWKIGHSVEWPDNVEFINEDISAEAEGLKMKIFDAVALDMVIPQKAVTLIVPSLKQGGVCAVYVANITQVIELLEAIHTSRSTLFCERIVEVMYRDWSVHPVAQRNSTTSQHLKSKGNTVEDTNYHNENDNLPAEQSEDDEIFVTDRAKPPYIARPCQRQTGHTAFLVKLRKFNPPNTKMTPDDVC
ncbi:tRNA (adenine(58)-N(1))-methyltransferase, mitochondrial isoform X1 [Paroedura picta]|uniref:tRNA (adenine(58)-N(1))-methyltransferase, mitochondrial isoform X1 n=1 Tax=Paroedura picta TaxID=143630 RepID=UPI004056B98D